MWIACWKKEWYISNIGKVSLFVRLHERQNVYTEPGLCLIALLVHRRRLNWEVRLQHTMILFVPIHEFVSIVKFAVIGVRGASTLSAYSGTISYMNMVPNVGGDRHECMQKESKSKSCNLRVRSCLQLAIYTA
ncbi:hypothetical protein ACHAW5_009048 [Stephanodiscus triporus]|uniref:Uncharacterized protein n=1 Tax=Stephanodiscus triporus TaxID=2934178 RepID=A0ABD3PAU4_9STRA